MKTFSIEHPDKGLIVFRDRKRYLWLASLFYPLLALSGIGLYVATGSEWALLTPLVSIYGGASLFDWWLGEDRNNPPEELVGQLEDDPYYRWLPMLTVPLHAIVLVAIAAFVGTQPLSLVRDPDPGADRRALQWPRHQHGTRTGSQEDRRSNAGWHASSSPSRPMAISASNTTAVTIATSRRRPTRPVRAWAKTSTSSPCARFPALSAVAGKSRRSAWRASASPSGIRKTKCCSPTP